MSKSKLVFVSLDETKGSTIFVPVKDQNNHVCNKIQEHSIVFHLSGMNSRKKAKIE